MAHGLRQQNRIGGRYLRKRRESEEENLFIDFNKDPQDIIHEILYNVVNSDINSNKKLIYLNGMVKLCMKQHEISDFGVSYRDIFCCLRTAFFHDTCEVRAGGLRACRYMLQNKEALEAFLQVKLHFLVSRSLDILLDNRMERIQALRLMRKVLSLNPNKFPRAFINCLVSIINEGMQERDVLRPCLATLSQLILLNPKACTEASSIDALLRNVVDSSQVQILEAVLGVIFYIINHPSTRSLLKDNFGLESLLAPFTDCHYRFPNSSDGTTSDDRDPNLSASKSAIVCTLLSWPGLIYLCRTDCTHLQSLVEMLYLPYAELRKNILDLLYQVFDVSMPEWTDDFSVALIASDPSSVKHSWQLFEGYVVAEGMDILPYTSNDRTNLVHNFYALLLLIFVQYGLLEALSEVIVSSDIYLSVRATIFLGEFIYLANQFLPLDCGHLSNCLPTLISSAASFESSRKQNQATAALTCLYRIHELKKRGPIPNSLVLCNILHVCNPDIEKKGFFAGTISEIKLWKYLKEEMSDTVDQAIKDTQVLTQDYISWDWDLINCILKNPNESLKKLDDASHRTFAKRLLRFFKPSSKEFSEMELDKDNGRQICNTGCHLFEYFLQLDKVKSQEYLDDFLADLNCCLLQLTKDTERLNSVLSPIKVMNTFSQMYFLFIGRLSSSHKGCKFLDRCNTFQNLFHLVSMTTQDIYIKLIVSALDYTKDGFSRTILTKVLTGTEEATRLYATNFLLVLLRAKLPDYRRWALEVLTNQLYDPSKMVSSAAISILDEACTIQENLEALTKYLRPPLLHMEDKGTLLLIRFLSVPSGLKFLKENNFLYHELKRWEKVYNLKYVKIIEDMLNEAFTHHRRNVDGTYGRRSSDVSHTVQNVYLPPHIYGQLAQHAEGIEVIEREDILSSFVEIIHSPDYSSDLSILKLKASLWAVGHIGSYSLGFSLILKENIISEIVNLAADAALLAIRGTCFFILGLLSSTPEGCCTLREFGWEAVRRNHSEKWPLIKEEFLIDYPQFLRKSTWSFSSMSYDWPFDVLPSSLSFFGHSSHLDLTRSQSQSSYCSNVDVYRNSLPTKSFTELQLKQSDFMNDVSDDDSRPRSSSDCQTERKDVIFHISESSSWDALNSSLSVTPPSNFNCFAKRRSISTSEVDESLHSLQTRLKEYDLSKDNHTADIAEHLSEDESFGPKLHSNERPSSLYPMSSDTSLNSSSKSSDSIARPTLLSQLSQGQNAHLHSPTSPNRPSSLLLTSARDALGYVTLKDIQRNRVSSSSFHNPSSNVDITLRHYKSKSLDADAAKTFNMFSVSLPPCIQNEISLTKSDDNSLKPSVPDADNPTPDPHYIGLSLPSKLEYIFLVPKQNVSECDISEDFTTVQPKLNENVFEFHTEENCLSNHFFNSKKCLQTTIIDEESEEVPIQSLKSAPKNFNKTYPPLDRSNSLKGMPKSKEDILKSQLQIRKEALRYVTNLCSSLSVKASEQGLLNLKQKFPNAFQDICLYSEICYYMANYNFRLSARRFMQELFLDVTFEQLQCEAEAIVGVVSIPQIAGSEA